jgi:hypothetical protein
VFLFYMVSLLLNKSSGFFHSFAYTVNKHISLWVRNQSVTSSTTLSSSENVRPPETSFKIPTRWESEGVTFGLYGR